MRTATLMTYVSDMGFTVQLRGTGLTYDLDGNASGGTVTRVTVSLRGVTYLDATDVKALLPRLTMWAFGFDRGPDYNSQDPDAFDLYQHLIRSSDTIYGSAQNDELTGGRGADVIYGGAGDDFIVADAGNDLIYGGAGRDTLNFDDANWDTIAYRGVNLDTQAKTVTDSWGGMDTVSGFEKFRDTIYSDLLRGNENNETFYVTRGNDVVDGRAGFDTVNYDKARIWDGTHGVNVNLSTGIAKDSWNGTDRLSNVEGVVGTSYNDTMTGSARSEYFVGGKGVDRIAAGDGFDWLGFWPAHNTAGGHGIVIDQTQTAVVRDDGFGNIETATGIEAFEGTTYADRFTGNAAANTFWGDAGNDTMSGGDGADNLRGGFGRDVLSGGNGNDKLAGHEGADRLTGGAGADRFEFWGPLGTGVDVITDMQKGIDSIWLDPSWGGGLTLDHLVTGQLRSGAGLTTATTAAHRVIYNTTTGDIYYDADGSGETAAVKFANVTNHAALALADFHVLLFGV